MFASWRGPFSPARRQLLKRAGAASVSLLIPACGPAEPPASAPGAGGDFTEGALRFDLWQRRVGNNDDFTLQALRFERQWPGRRDRLTDGPGWGDYRLSLYDQRRDALLFREGFDTGIDPHARAATTRFSIRCPLPRRPARITIERRGGNDFREVARIAVDPASEDIDRSVPGIKTRVEALIESGAPAAKVDIAILGDGYREAEYPKFAADAARATSYLFSVEPFRKRKSDFNVRSVFAASADSGVTDPYLGLRKETVFGAAYGSGGAERTLEDRYHSAVREAASAVPYDFLLVLANARRYGASARFGGPAVVAIDNAAARYLVIHEFAHVIGGLADEYYLAVAGAAPYSGAIEPWHPNVTAAPGTGKWRDLVPASGVDAAGWNKAEYERYFAGYVKRYEALRSAGAEEAAVEKFLEVEGKRQAALLAKNGRERRVGYFEGADGYEKGLFRSEADCVMFSLQTEYFCAACAAAIERMIDYHCT